jgi:putative superfamily III holin-X
VAKPSNKSVPQVAGELWTLTKDYARQETLDPLKGVGRYLAYGFGGAVLASIGVIMLLLSLLRGLQDHSTLTGNLSWLQYLIVLAAGALLAGLAASRIRKSSAKAKAKRN